MTDRILFVHAGGSKTGSSALQNFFEINAAQLESHGFAYLNKVNINSDYQINSGNGKSLYKLLMAKTANDSKIDNLVLSYFGCHDKAICSSEFFASFQFAAQHWKKLFESTTRLGVELKVIFFVRNVIPFLQSSYDQGIKRHGLSKSFDEWVVDADWQHVKALRIIAKELPKSNVEVIHFDQQKPNLIKGFLDIPGINASFEINENDQKRQVNRSLNEKEREALKTVNKALGKTYSEELSNFLIYARPNIQGEPVFCNQKTTEFLLNKFNNDVDWVNNTFFKGQRIVSVLPIGADLSTLANKPDPIPAKKGSLETRLFNWAIKKLKTVLEGEHPLSPKMLKTLIAAGRDEPKKLHPELPDDFNSLAYLLLNTDVLYAGLDPTLHYTQHGKQEGRPYKFKD